MTRRGLCSGSITVQRRDGPMTAGAPPAVALVLLEGEAWTGDGRRLGALDFLMLGPGPENLVYRQALVATINVQKQSGGEARQWATT